MASSIYKGDRHGAYPQNLRDMRLDIDIIADKRNRSLTVSILMKTHFGVNNH